MTTIYTVRLGADRIAWLTDTGSAIAIAGKLDHVGGVGEQPDPDTMVFDNAVAEILRDLPDDHDGHLDSDGRIWFGGLDYEVRVRD